MNIGRFHALMPLLSQIDDDGPAIQMTMFLRPHVMTVQRPYTGGYLTLEGDGVS